MRSQVLHVLCFSDWGVFDEWKQFVHSYCPNALDSIPVVEMQGHPHMYVLPNAMKRLQWAWCVEGMRGNKRISRYDIIL